MTEYEFSIVASGLDPEADDFPDRLFEAGCDDATVAYARGAFIISFRREAASLQDAVTSAVEALKVAGATIDRIEPDSFVSLSEIAKRAGLTRAALTNYAHGLRGEGFPRPVARVTTESPLYDWPSVAQWLSTRGKLSREAVDDAVLIKAFNTDLTAEHSAA